jgi:hypothetical protein
MAATVNAKMNLIKIMQILTCQMTNIKYDHQKPRGYRKQTDGF